LHFRICNFAAEKIEEKEEAAPAAPVGPTKKNCLRKLRFVKK
jgi:hypothetical protein